VAEAAITRDDVGRDYSIRAAVRVLGALLRPYRGRIVLAFLFLLMDISGMLFIPTELSVLVNTAITSPDAADLVPHGVAMLIAAVAGSGGCIISYWMVSRIAADVGRDLRVAVYEKSLELSDSDFEGLGTGSMITRTLSDANVIQQSILMTFVMALPVPFVCVVSVVLAMRIDHVMGRMLLVLVVVMLVISALAVHCSSPTFLVMQGFVDRMNVRLRETITGVRVIRAFDREKSVRERLDESFDSYAKSAIRVNMVFAVADSSTFFLMNVVEVLIVWMGADRVAMQAMQIGSISALLEYALNILFFMMMAQFALLGMPRALACLTRAAEVFDKQPTVLDPEKPVAPASKPGVVSADAGPHEEVVRFDDVSFRFEDADEDTLRDLSFAMRRGQVTAIIGNTGSGKSTIARLLLRSHDVTAGSISLLGCDVRDLTQQELRSRIAYVPQKAWLFSGTIAENLRHGNPEATDEELWHALDVAQAGFVRDSPAGLDTRVAQGGSNFSGGQRQRLAIARALVRRADLYVFDDSFSALDYRTDAALRHALAGELDHAATLLIAQRVSTIRAAAQIIVLSHGEVLGIGTHDELLRDCENYREIAESQERGGVARG
jgi:ATP-binding cassette subfamily B multidrug efflux pump